MMELINFLSLILFTVKPVLSNHPQRIASDRLIRGDYLMQVARITEFDLQC